MREREKEEMKGRTEQNNHHKKARNHIHTKKSYNGKEIQKQNNYNHNKK